MVENKFLGRLKIWFKDDKLYYRNISIIRIIKFGCDSKLPGFYKKVGKKPWIKAIPHTSFPFVFELKDYYSKYKSLENHIAIEKAKQRIGIIEYNVIK